MEEGKKNRGASLEMVCEITHETVTCSVYSVSRF